MIYYVNGNLLDSNVDYICHQVNCQGVMGSGIAGQIKARWPIVYESYIAKYEAAKRYVSLDGERYFADELLLGDIQIVALWEDYYKTDFHQSVINMFSQQYYGYDKKRYTSYDAFWNCLNLIKYNIPKGSKVGFPERIGCGLGGANWTIIRTMIEVVLDKDFEVYIYNYDGGNNK